MPEVEIVDLRALTEFVKAEFDYDFSEYAMSSFKRRINRILEMYEFHSVRDLINELKSKPSFFQEFLSEITVNVTEIFRDPSFWREIRDHVIPNILLNNDKIRIWHAGCSSGEEVFSMAILLKENGWLEKSQIIATDIDNAILERAKKGTFSAKNIDLNNRNYIRFQGKSSFSDYYTVKKNDAFLNQDLAHFVSFREQNLVKDEVFNKFDLVLCRNVMIYFNQNLQNKVLKTLHGSLFRYGYLAIGSKESLIWCEIANKFIVANNEEKIYKKIKD